MRFIGYWTDTSPNKYISSFMYVNNEICVKWNRKIRAEINWKKSRQPCDANKRKGLNIKRRGRQWGWARVGRRKGFRFGWLIFEQSDSFIRYVYPYVELKEKKHRAPKRDNQKWKNIFLNFDVRVFRVASMLGVLVWSLLFHYNCYTAVGILTPADFKNITGTLFEYFCLWLWAC